MDNADMIPKVVEPLFQQFSAILDIIPLMSLDDLKPRILKNAVIVNLQSVFRG